MISCLLILCLHFVFAKDFSSSLSPCQCDLTTLKCDINCCCDPDCADTIYNQTCPSTPCINCPLFSNSPVAGFFYPPPLTVSTDAEFQQLLPQSTSVNSEFSIIYKPLDPIEILYASGRTGKLVLKQQYLNSCFDATPVLFMQDYTSSCDEWVDSCETGDAPSLILGFKVLSQPYNVNASTVGVQADSIPPQAKANGASCLNYVTGTYITITYNETFGLITDVNFAFNLSTVSIGSQVSVKSVVTFSNGKDEAAVTRSGNPGYIQGLPILASPNASLV